jgi:mannose-6-phosphate isomerase-like protein (cupin superfamily)
MFISKVASRAVFLPGKAGKSNLVRGDFLFAGLNAFEPGQAQPVHSHAGQDKLYYVVEGEAIAEVGGEESYAGPTDLVLAPAGVPHGIRNAGPGRLIVMVVFGPPPVAGG